MSNYTAKTFNPITKEYEDAVWYDDYFGRHQYGVFFESNKGKAFTPEEIYEAERKFLKLKPEQEGKECCEECFKWGDKYGEYKYPCLNPNCKCHKPKEIVFCGHYSKEFEPCKICNKVEPKETEWEKKYTEKWLTMTRKEEIEFIRTLLAQKDQYYKEILDAWMEDRKFDEKDIKSQLIKEIEEKLVQLDKEINATGKPMVELSEVLKILTLLKT